MIAYRKLVPADLPALRAFFERLDPEDSHARFAGPASAAVIDSYLQRIDWLTSVFLGCIVDGTLRGIAELRSLSLIDRHCEFAVIVERPFQGRGLGTALTRRALALAQNRGIVRVTMLCLTENRRMRAIAVRLGCRFVHENGQVVADLSVPLADREALVRELLDEAAAFADRLAWPVPRIPLRPWE